MYNAVWVCHIQTGIKAVHTYRSCQQDPSLCIWAGKPCWSRAKAVQSFLQQPEPQMCWYPWKIPPFLFKNNRITTVSRSSFRQAAGDGFLCVLSVPEGTVTTSSPYGLNGRWDKSRNQGHERTWWPREGQEQVKEMEGSWFNRLSDSLGGETST